MTGDALPPLNPTRVFEVAARLGSVTRAAEQLVVTPAAVSRQVRALERYLGTALFDRVPGGLRLTDAGRYFLGEVEPAMRSLARAAEAVRDGTSFRAVVLRLTSPATFAVRWLIPQLADFHQQHPSIQVSLRTSTEPVKLTGEVDGGIELSASPNASAESSRLIPNVLVPVAAPGYVRGDTLDQAGLDEVVLLHSLARMEDWAFWLAAGGLTKADARNGMRYENSLLAYQAAIEGQGVAMAQLALVASDLDAGRLVTVSDTVVDRGSWTYYFVSPRHTADNPALTVFKRWLQATAGAGD